MIAAADTLVYDTAQIAAWQSDAAYAYNRELAAPEVNLMEWIVREIDEVLNKLFGIRVVQEYSELFWITVSLLIMGLVVWFVYKKHPMLFVRSGKGHTPYIVEEDSIYGVDFEQRIGQALSRADYREAVRLLYLQTLKWLSDAGRIDWQPYKTPTQYLYEVRLPAFRQLTNHFLRVRYGNFEATETLFRDMRVWQEELKRGAAG